jgi:hypothetical protein
MKKLRICLVLLVAATCYWGSLAAQYEYRFADLSFSNWASEARIIQYHIYANPTASPAGDRGVVIEAHAILYNLFKEDKATFFLNPKFLSNRLDSSRVYDNGRASECFFRRPIKMYGRSGRGDFKLESVVSTKYQSSYDYTFLTIEPLDSCEVILKFTYSHRKTDSFERDIVTDVDASTIIYDYCESLQYIMRESVPIHWLPNAFAFIKSARYKPPVLHIRDIK